VFVYSMMVCDDRWHTWYCHRCFSGEFWFSFASWMIPQALLSSSHTKYSTIICLFLPTPLHGNHTRPLFLQLSFTPASESQNLKILSNCPNKQSDFDSIPTWLLNAHLFLSLQSLTSSTSLSFLVLICALSNSAISSELEWPLTTPDHLIFRSTPASRPNKVGLKCLSARPYIRLSTKSFIDFNEIWSVGRGRWVMHDRDGMQYDPMKVKVMSPWKSEIWPYSKAISSPIYNEGWQMTMDS